MNYIFFRKLSQSINNRLKFVENEIELSFLYKDNYLFYEDTKKITFSLIILHENKVKMEIMIKNHSNKIEHLKTYILDFEYHDSSKTALFLYENSPIIRFETTGNHIKDVVFYEDRFIFLFQLMNKNYNLILDNLDISYFVLLDNYDLLDKQKHGYTFQELAIFFTKKHTFSLDVSFNKERKCINLKHKNYSYLTLNKDADLKKQYFTDNDYDDIYFNDVVLKLFNEKKIDYKNIDNLMLRFLEDYHQLTGL